MSTEHQELLWFHAFDRDAPIDILRVVMYGAYPNPNEHSKTRKAEQILGIEPTRAYAFLGRTHDEFGERAVAVRQSGVNGEVSPFDTGALRKHTAPVSNWPLDQKRAYIEAYTWSSDSLIGLLAQYPGQNLLAYLRAERPSHEGPHVPFPDRFASAPVWREPNEWQCWTWEARAQDMIETGVHLLAWSCLPDEYSLLMEALGDLDDDELDADTALLLELKYVEGGVGSLVATLLPLQGAR